MSGAIGTWRPDRSWRPIIENIGSASVALLLPVTYLVGSLLTPLVHPAIAMYLLQPACWLFPAAVVLWLLGDRWGELFAGRQLLASAVGLVGLQIGLAILAGFFFGFGDSPYAHTALALPGTLWYIGATVIGREVVRWFVARALRPSGERITLLATAALLWPAALAPAGLSALTEPHAALPYLVQLALPAAAVSLLATVLALRGGPIAAIGYAGGMLAVEWAAPVLPDLPWPIAGAIGTLVPLIGSAWLLDRHSGDERHSSPRFAIVGKQFGLLLPLLVVSAIVLAILVPVTNASWTDHQAVQGRVSMGNFCPINADVKITPTVLDGDQKNGTVTVHVSFPGGLPPVYDEDQIDPGTVSLRAIGGGSTGPSRGDKNPLKFDKASVIGIIGGKPTAETDVTFELRGQAGGCSFVGSDTVTYRPPKKTPTKTPTPTNTPKSAPRNAPTGADPSATAAPIATTSPTAAGTAGVTPTTGLTPTTEPTATPQPTTTPEPTSAPSATAVPTKAKPKPTEVPEPSQAPATKSASNP